LAGLGPAIHVFMLQRQRLKNVDPRSSPREAIKGRILSKSRGRSSAQREGGSMNWEESLGAGFDGGGGGAT
jgi:hypothetical protein